MWIPIILMVLTIFGLFWYYKNKKKNNDSTENKIWIKARYALFILMPFMAFFEIITDDISGRNKNIIATIINFFITKSLFQYFDDNPVIIKYPKLSIVGMSLIIFVIQLFLGSLITF